MSKKRVLRVHLNSPDNDISPEELSKIRDVLNSMEDWQLTGEGIEDVQNFTISASYDCDI